MSFKKSYPFFQLDLKIEGVTTYESPKLIPCSGLRRLLSLKRYTPYPASISALCWMTCQESPRLHFQRIKTPVFVSVWGVGFLLEIILSTL